MAKAKDIAAKAAQLAASIPSGDGGAPAAADGVKPPPFGTPKKLSTEDVAGELPRECDQLDRVPRGSSAKRYKCRISNESQFGAPRYHLALDEEGARASHLEASGFNGYVARLKKQGVKDDDLVAPVVVVTELQD